MGLTVGALNYLLERQGLRLCRGEAPQRAAIKELRFDSRGIRCVTEEQEEYMLIPAAEPDETCWTLLCPDRFSGADKVFFVYQSYLQWKNRMMESAGTEEDIQSLVESAALFLGIPITFVDYEYRYLAVSSNMEESFMTDRPGDRMPLWRVKLLFEGDPDFAEKFRSKGLQYYGEGSGDWAIFFYNVLCEDVYYGRILIPTKTDTVDEGLSELIKELMGALQSCFMTRSFRSSLRQPHDVWRELLEKGTLDEMAALNMLLTMGWKLQQRYQVLFLRPVGYLYDAHTLKFMATELEGRFPSCIVVTEEKGLLCLHNLEREKSRDFQREFSVFLRENLFKCGVSNDFTSFLDSPVYSGQAREALAIGEKREPSLWRWDYSDCLFEAILRHARGKYPLAELCGEELRRLLEYERAQPELELAETLYQYIACCFNAVQAAERLHIHRTTFSHRMKRIRQIADLHPEDPKEHLTLYVALSALRAEKESAQ